MDLVLSLIQKQIVDYNSYLSSKMLASTKKSAINSTMASSRGVVPKGKESFFAFIFRKIRQSFNKLWMFSRRFLWVSSTGLIVIILPFAFAYFLEMQKELMKIQSMDGRAAML